MSHLFYVMTVPGLETLAFSELRTQVADAELVKFARGIALFRTAARLSDLLELRTIEDLFLSLAHITGLGHGSGALRVLHSATLRADITSALATWRRVHSGKKPKTWRVVSQMWGPHEYRRVDAGQAVADALQRLMPSGMRHVKDDADVEIWLWLGGTEALVGIRLSDATMRHREYKREHLPASLRPTAAAAMALLARPTAHDIVIDPLCGAGTIIIERALLAPYDELIGGDINEKAVEAAQHNARDASVSAEWNVWNACSLPLEQESVTRIITNLPFGKQIGTREANADLYKKLIQEFGRVLTSDGLLVALTSEDRLWQTVLRDHGWKVMKKVVLVILGQPASIFVAERI